MRACIPMRGWMKRPEIGPASKTMATDDFVRPRESIYGVPMTGDDGKETQGDR